MPEQRYGSVVTARGQAAIAAAIAGGTRPKVTHAAVGDGDGAYYYPTADQTALKRERWRGEIVSAVQNVISPNMVDVTVVLPADVGNFTIREAAVFLADGTALAICNLPDTEKVNVQVGVSGAFKLILHIAVEDSSVLEFVITPSTEGVTPADLQAAIEAHNADPNAHPNLQPGGGGGSGGVVAQASITIPTAGWEESGEDDYPWQRRVECELAKPELVPCVILDPSGMITANGAGLCPAVRTLDGALLFLARRVPEQDMTASLLLYEDGAQAEQIDVTIPTDGWAVVGEEDTGISESYRLRCDLPLEKVTEDMVPILAVLPEYQLAALDCGLCPTCRTGARYLRLYTRAAPAAELRGSLTLLVPPDDD